MPSLGETPADTALRQAWSEFCDELKASADLLFRPEVPGSERVRAEGFRYLARYIGKALDEELDYADPLCPQFLVLQRPTSKTFGDNPDCTYLVCNIDGGETYRIVGNRGSVHWVRFSVTGTSAGAGAEGLRISANTIFDGSELRTEWDGAFELILSPDPQPGKNWIKTEPGPARVMVRQFYGHWDRETPLTARIERVGGDAPAALTADHMVAALGAASGYIRNDSERWFRWIEYYRRTPNIFVAGRPDWAGDNNVAEQSAGRWLHFCAWELQSDEALLIEFQPPQCAHWIFELNNYWMNSMDYRYHLSSLNKTQAAVEADGSVRIVLSPTDAGLANWLDSCGHPVGLLISRWVDGSSNPTPSTRLVKITDIDGLVGPDAHRVTPADRAAELWRRKAGVDRRFPVG